ncbi:hypothetical protein JCM10556A_28630 [Bacteroides acidifaciens]|uniref:Uncharacterized protein n=1 Tax=Bacteroides acidifaciens TaxID=85831 RepID=A0A7J0A104_9BACE|nr:hypothetical protein IMSAGC001_01458 [Bacteroides acidifaciens]
MDPDPMTRILKYKKLGVVGSETWLQGKNWCIPSRDLCVKKGGSTIIAALFIACVTVADLDIVIMAITVAIMVAVRTTFLR